MPVAMETFVFIKTLEDALEEEGVGTKKKCSNYKMFKTTAQSLIETSDNTYAFFPQMVPLYQFRQVLKYFFLVPSTS